MFCQQAVNAVAAYNIRHHRVPTEQMTACEAAQILLEPSRERHGEALLGPIDEVGGEIAAHRLLQEVLSPAAAQLDAERHLVGLLDDAVVEVRRANLQ